MHVKIESLLQGAKKAEGVVVIIDVFRAFSVVPCLLANKAERVIPVDSVDKAFRIKKEIPSAVLVGERKGIKIENFDYGNSPSCLESIDFNNKDVIMSTSSGTRGIINAERAQQILTGSFVNASAIIEYIRKKQPQSVTLVAMGVRAEEERDEDRLCARYLKNKLEGRESDFTAIVNHLKDYKSSQKFLDPSLPEFPEQDFWFSMDLDRYNFAVKAYKNFYTELRKS